MQIITAPAIKKACSLEKEDSLAAYGPKMPSQSPRACAGCSLGSFGSGGSAQLSSAPRETPFVFPFAWGGIAVGRMGTSGMAVDNY